MTLLLIGGITLLLIFIFGYNALIGKRNQVDNAFAALDAMFYPFTSKDCDAYER